MKKCIALEISSMLFRNKIIIHLKSVVFFKIFVIIETILKTIEKTKKYDGSKLNHLYFLEYLPISESVYPMNIMSKQFEWTTIK